MKVTRVTSELIVFQLTLCVWLGEFWRN